MDSVVRTLQDFVETAVETRTAQMRDEHLHDNRMLSEHYLKRIKSLTSACREGRREAKQARTQREGLEELVENLERDKLELEDDQRDSEEENAQLEERVEELEGDNALLKEKVERLQGREIQLEKELDLAVQTEFELIEENAQLEEERDVLAFQKSDLEGQTVLLDQQVQTWKDRYEKTFAEKVAVQIQYGAPPRLPIELLTMIASFSASANCFGTLAALCQSSKLVSQECSPYLYETMIWTSRVQRRLDGYVERGQYPEVWKHVRHIVVDKINLASLPSEAFPNKRAVLIKKMTNEFQWTRNNANHSSSHQTIQLVLWKTIRSDTLDAILRYPLKWIYADDIAVRGRVRGITSITLHRDAYFLPGNSSSMRQRFVPTAAGLAFIHIKHAGADERTHTSIGEICRYVTPNTSRMAPEQIQALRKDLVVNIANEAQIGFWLQELPSVLRLEPLLRLDFVVSSRMNEQLVIQHVTSFIEMYKSVWPELRSARRQDRHPASIAFFTLHNFALSEADELGQCPYIAVFTTLPLTNQFRALVIHNTVVDEVKMSVFVYEGIYPERNVVAEDEQGFMDDHTDSSSLTDLSDED